MATVTVIGSGAAGLTAALAARLTGASATVYERYEHVGGTTALSGGNAWLPAHHQLDDDTPEAALTYLRALALGDADDDGLRAFAHGARATAEWVERETSLELAPLAYPDYHAEFAGGRPQGGRTLEPQPYRPSPRAARLVRDAPNVTAPITYAELAGGAIDRELLRERRAAGIVTMGRALVAGLLDACLAAGVVVETGRRVRTLPDEGAVVLATGGFERNPQLARAFLRGPVRAPVGAGGAEGDGLRMAMGAGAQLGCMSEAWWCPAISIPGEMLDGGAMYRLILTERARPGSLIVDTAGRRFVDEAQNYNDLGRTMLNFEATSYSLPHARAWLVFDGAYRKRYRVGPLGRRDPDPPWLERADELGTLAERIGVPPTALESTVEVFNAHAENGEDPDFGRGSFPYDRFMGDLGPLGDGPYYALALHPGCLGTKGGPRTDVDGRVLAAADGAPIPRLHAAGNAAASPFGLGYPGAGATLGQALFQGLRAGTQAAGG